MSTKIRESRLIPFNMQAGEGTPNHLSPAGTFYFDSLSGLTYQNTNGVNNWVGFFNQNNQTIDVYVTGGTYDNNSGIASFINNTGGTFSVTGFSANSGGLFTGGTVSGNTIFTSGLTATTISATTYINLPTSIDRFVTGGTYSNGISTFTNNTGGTFSVSGYYTGFTGGVVSGLTATTISAATYLNLPTSIDTYVTGFTYNNSNNFTLSQNQGQSPLIATINTVTGLTVNGNLNATTISATTISGVTLYGNGSNLTGLPSSPSSITIGTTPIISGTTGRVLFQGTGATVSQSSNLFWDNTNNQVVTPKIVGGTGTTSSLTLQGTTGVGSTSDIALQALVGNNGSLSAFRVRNNGTIVIGTNTGQDIFSVLGTQTIIIPGSVRFAGGSETLILLDGKFYNPFGNCGLLFQGNAIVPLNSAGNGIDVTTNLGSTSFRFNTLFSRSAVLGAGTSTAGSAPLKINSGATMTTPEAGAMEFNGTNLFFTPSTTRNILAQVSGSTPLTSGRVPVATTNGYLTDGLILSAGTYTPTLTPVTNITSLTATTCQFMRVGSVVTVSGLFITNPTSNNTRTTFGMSLPVASNFTAISNCGGLAHTTVNTTAGHAAAIYADTTNDRAEVDYFETHGGTDTFSFTFTYTII